MTRLNRTWQLPPPPKTKEDEWLPVIRVGHHIPFGYEQDPNDPDLLLPIKKELELLKKAKKHLKKYSTREVANWLTRESGRYISHMGLIKRVKIESKRQREATNARLYAEKYKKALEKAEELSNRIGGANTRIVSSDSP
jgi:hypothetical protein